MSSFFEGQYRRTPEQNLSGANHTENRDQFLQRAHSERQKREDNRRRFLCSIKIQSFVRSYLVRKKMKQKQREEFQEVLRASRNCMNLDTLGSLTIKLLFFYDMTADETCLLAISKLLLDKQFKSSILEASFSPSNIWSVRTRKLLALNLQLMSHKASDRTFNSAVSLRLLETFTKVEEAESRLCQGRDVFVAQFTKLLRYLVENHFYQHIRVLLDAKVPPLLEPTSSPPTPLSQCLFDLLITPLIMMPICRACDPMYSCTVMDEFIRHIIGAPMTESIKLYVLPALAQLTSFPYKDCVLTIHSNFAKNIPYSSNANILYALLTLDSSHALLTNQRPDSSSSTNERPDVSLVSAHLSVIARSATELVRMAGTSRDEEEEEDQGDIDMDQKEQLSPVEQQLLEECCNIFNQNRFVQGVLSTVERYYQDISVLQPLCQLCHSLLMSHRLACHRFRLLHMLALNHRFVRQLYLLCTSLVQKSLFNTGGPPVTLLSVIARGSPTSAAETRQIVPLLATWASLFSLLVTTLHDNEFYRDAMGVEDSASGALSSNAHENKMPFSLSELGSMTSVLKNVVLGLIELAYPDSRMKDVYSRQSATDSTQSIVTMWCHLFKSLVSLLRSLHSRDSRRRFTSGDSHWSCPSLTTLLGTGGYDTPSGLSLRTRAGTSRPPFCRLPPLTREDLEEGPPLSTRELRLLAILRDVPFLVSFPARVLVLTRELARDKAQHQSRAPYLQGPQIQISVRRNYLYEDAFDKLSPENEPDLRLVMRVQLVNAVGLDEAGIDGGGLFREFLSELLKTAFDPKLGFFRLTEDNLLYPNPGVSLIHPDYLKHYYFIGRMLGKALYENLLVEIPLADLFLSKLVSRHSDVDIHHLATLDALLYRNLLSLKNVEDVTDLGLDFTVLCDELGERRIIELKPQGASIPVTNSNRIEYIHLVADYYLNKRIRAQCAVFKQGLSDVIAPDLLQMFNSRELGTLISGAETPIDLEDLKAHVSYLGGYSSDHETIQMFWRVVTEFTDSERKALLKFVTSCSRPPLLGFKELDPPFGIQLINAEDRLPSASTCMNLLKLPKFTDVEKLRERLVYAISSHCGFELS